MSLAVFFGSKASPGSYLLQRAWVVVLIMTNPQILYQ